MRLVDLLDTLELDFEKAVCVYMRLDDGVQRVAEIYEHKIKFLFGSPYRFFSAKVQLIFGDKNKTGMVAVMLESDIDV